MKSYIKLTAAIVLALFLLLILNFNNIAPDSPFFAVKRTEEKIFMDLKLTKNARISYQRFLLEQRLHELEQLAKAKKYPYILEAASRYSSTAGQLTEMVLNSSDKQLSEQTVNQFRSHKTIVRDLYDQYPKDDTEGKYILDDENYLDLYIDKIQSAN